MNRSPDHARQIPRPAFLILFLVYAAFIALGMPDGLFGVAWPTMRKGFGVPIDAIKMGFTATDPNSQEAQMVTMMYGQGMNGRIAVVNNLLVYAFAGDPNPVVREMIDQVKAGGTTATASTEVDTATKLIPAAEKADFFMTFNLLRAFQMASAMLPMGIPPVSAQSQSNIAVAGNADGGKLSIELAVPKQHVTEIMTAFMQMQQGQR